MKQINSLYDHGDLRKVEVLIKINEIIDAINKLIEAQNEQNPVPKA